MGPGSNGHPLAKPLTVYDQKLLTLVLKVRSLGLQRGPATERVPVSSQPMSAPVNPLDLRIRNMRRIVDQIEACRAPLGFARLIAEAKAEVERSFGALSAEFVDFGERFGSLTFPDLSLAESWDVHNFETSVGELLGHLSSLALRLEEQILSPAAQVGQRSGPLGEYLADELGEKDIERIVTAIAGGVSKRSLAIMARWWQLETYLRTLVYIQLQGLFGPSMGSEFQKEKKRLELANEHSYMASADDGYLPSQFDVGALLKLIDKYWDQCQFGIGLPKAVWSGRIDELIPVRHRLAHCRRPHVDDADRIDQLLRDLEPAANRVFRAYTDWSDVDPGLVDPVVDDWVRLQHNVSHLVEHGRERKGIDFSLRAVELPGATCSGLAVTGSPGWFWVMHAYVREGGLYIDDYLRDTSVQKLMPMVTHIVQPSRSEIAVTIAAVGDPHVTSNLIGGLLEAVFSEREWGGVGSSVRHPTRRVAQGLDPRVDAQGILSILSGLNPGDHCSIFG